MTSRSRVVCAGGIDAQTSFIDQAQGGGVGNQNGPRVRDQRAGWQVRPGRACKQCGHGRGLRLASRDQDDLFRGRYGGQPLCDAPGGHLVQRPEEPGVVAPGGLAQHGDAGALGERRAGFVEADVAVAADPEQLEVHPADITQ